MCKYLDWIPIVSLCVYILFVLPRQEINKILLVELYGEKSRSSSTFF